MKAKLRGIFLKSWDEFIFFGHGAIFSGKSDGRILL